MGGAGARAAGAVRGLLTEPPSRPEPTPGVRPRPLAPQTQGGGNCANALTAAARLGLAPTIVTKVRAPFRASKRGQALLFTAPCGRAQHAAAASCMLDSCGPRPIMQPCWPSSLGTGRDRKRKLPLPPQIGGDGLGDGILSELQADGVDTSLVLRAAGNPSPFTYIIVDRQGVRSWGGGGRARWRKWLWCRERVYCYEKPMVDAAAAPPSHPCHDASTPHPQTNPAPRPDASRPGGTRTCIHTPGAPMTPSEMTRDLITSALAGAALVYFDGRLTEAALLLARAARAAGVPVLVEGERLRPGLEQLLAEADYVVTSAHFPQASQLPPATFNAPGEIFLFLLLCACTGLVLTRAACACTGLSRGSRCAEAEAGAASRR